MRILTIGLASTIEFNLFERLLNKGHIAFVMLNVNRRFIYNTGKAITTRYLQLNKNYITNPLIPKKYTLEDLIKSCYQRNLGIYQYFENLVG